MSKQNQLHVWKNKLVQVHLKLRTWSLPLCISILVVKDEKINITSEQEQRNEMQTLRALWLPG